MKICCVFNYNPLYRLPIYRAMSKEFDCEFFFGDTVFAPLKQFDPNELPGFKGYMHARRTRFGYVWCSNIKRIFDFKYTHYVITGDSTYLINWLIYIHSFFFRKKVIMWTHGMKDSPRERKDFKIVSRFYRAADALLMYNHRNCKYTAELGVDCRKMYVIHNSLDTPVQTTYYNELKKSNIYRNHFYNDNPVVFFIGRIQKRMQLSLLVDAIAHLKSKGLMINLVIVGPVVDDIELESYTAEKGLSENVWFYGASYDEKENAQLIYDADICVVPGSIGLTAIHSLSYGTPVISNDNFSTQMPEAEAIIDGKTGSFFNEGDATDLANKIEMWIGKSKQERAEIRNAARTLILSSWSIDYQIEVLKQLFAEV